MPDFTITATPQKFRPRDGEVVVGVLFSSLRFASFKDGWNEATRSRIRYASRGSLI